MFGAALGIGVAIGVALSTVAWLQYDARFDDPAVAAAAKQEAREGYVMLSELSAAEARVEILETRAALQEQLLKDARAARETFEADLRAASRQRDAANDELREIEARARNDACTVDNFVYQRLRAK